MLRKCTLALALWTFILSDAQKQARPKGATTAVFADQVKEVAAGSQPAAVPFAAALEDRVRDSGPRVCVVSGEELGAAMDAAYDRVLASELNLKGESRGDNPIFTNRLFNSWVQLVLNPHDLPLDAITEPILRTAAAQVARRHGFHAGDVIAVPRSFMHGPVNARLVRTAAAECAASIDSMRASTAAAEARAAAEELAAEQAAALLRARAAGSPPTTGGEL